jgi:hypothetical protein
MKGTPESERFRHSEELGIFRNLQEFAEVYSVLA